MFAYTNYYGNDGRDDAIARILVCYSCDEGETWSMPETLIEKPPELKNIMSPGFVRLGDGNLGILYSEKRMVNAVGLTCMPVFRMSRDEGKSWTMGTSCIEKMGYYCSINAGAKVLRSGKLHGCAV